MSETFPHAKEKIFAAFMRADALVQWIAPTDDMPTTVEKLDFVPEGGFRIAFKVGDDVLHLNGQFLVIQAHDHLSFTWVWEAPAPHANVESHVSISLNTLGSKTEMTLTHSRLDAAGMADRHRSGWLGCFARLNKTLKEDTL
nr:SRPBCC domain-containing protein [Yoonia sp. I 8.24]